MKFYYPKDKQGNPVSFKTLESQVFDSNGVCLSDKLAIATEDNDGIMSSQMVKTLNNISTTGGTYELPVASKTLGGVRTTSDVTSSDGYTACPIIEGVPYYKSTSGDYLPLSGGTLSGNVVINIADIDGTTQYSGIRVENSKRTGSFAVTTTGELGLIDNNGENWNWVICSDNEGNTVVPTRKFITNGGFLSTKSCNIDSDGWGNQLTVTRTNLATDINGKEVRGNATIKFRNLNEEDKQTIQTLGYLGMNTVDGPFTRYCATDPENNKYVMLDEGNYKTYITPANIGAAKSSHTHDYLPLSGGTLNGALTIKAAQYTALTINRSDAAGNTGIVFTNTDVSDASNPTVVSLGSIFMNTVDGGLRRYTADWKSNYVFLDTGNYKTHVTPANIGALALTGGTVTGATNFNNQVIFSYMMRATNGYGLKLGSDYQNCFYVASSTIKPSSIEQQQVIIGPPASESSFASVIRGATIWINSSFTYYKSPLSQYTSDARLKTDEGYLDNFNDKTSKYLTLWEKMIPRAFRMIEDVEKNGDEAKYLLGYYAQEIEEALNGSGLTEKDFAGLSVVKDFVDESENSDDNEYLDNRYFLSYDQCSMLTDIKLRQMVNETIPTMQTTIDMLKAQVEELTNIIAELKGE